MNFIRNTKGIIAKVSQDTGIPSEVIFAMSAIESDWGTSKKAKEQNNYFGIRKP